MPAATVRVFANKFVIEVWPRAATGRSAARVSVGGLSVAGWQTAQRCDLHEPAGRRGFPRCRETIGCYAAGIRARERNIAFTGAALSSRMNAPSRVLNKNLASTRAPSSAAHDA